MNPIKTKGNNIKKHMDQYINNKAIDIIIGSINIKQNNVM